MRRLRWLAPLAILLMLPMLACGGSEPPRPADSGPPEQVVAQPTAPPQQVFGVGQAAQVGDTVVTVESAERVQELSQFQQADPGNEFVRMQVAVQNAGAGTVSYNTFHWTATDPDGFSYNPAIVTERGLASGELQPGGIARGFVAFQVPAGAPLTVTRAVPLGSSVSFSVP